MDYKITNIKVSVKSPTICLDTAIKMLLDLNIRHRKYLNYIVIQSKYTYIIFKPKCRDGMNHVNITKIPHFGEIENAKMHLCDLLKLEIFSAPVIDNITVSTKFENNCTPSNLILLFSNTCRITFNQETFPGVFLKFSYGTAIVFHTGRCILIGCKTIENIEQILITMKKVFEQND